MPSIAWIVRSLRDLLTTKVTVFRWTFKTEFDCKLKTMYLCHFADNTNSQYVITRHVLMLHSANSNKYDDYYVSLYFLTLHHF
jgi:hypothetical protein